MSTTEVKSYFNTEKDRICKPTAYAKKCGADTNFSGECDWWLRVPDDDETRGWYVGCDRGYIFAGAYMKRNDIAVRPAVWIRIEQYPLLKIGSKGEDVVLLQQKLIECGVLDGSVDGVYGNMTVDAVIEMQKQFAMEPTGIADNAFQRRLFSGD